MPSDNIWLAAASSSLAVAVLTQLFTIGREKLAHRADQRLSALHVALALESYAGECARVVGDKETHISSDGHHGSDWSTIPALPDWPLAIDWKRLGIKNTEKAFALRVEVDAAKAKISDQYNFDPPDGGDAAVLDDAIRLGLKALALASTIRSQAKLDPAVEAEWPIGRYLEERRVDRAERQRQYLADAEARRLASPSTGIL
ncbi:hypothetical protein N4G62_17535 [Sphingomonas sanguinis]|uniref:Uncharacterized protein n=1 Tax=Sphingomonas sanguinis TaxID=33051 RepID=A0ABU5LV93_9SPHN|nr:hypothetical protein [Sphingomonas sanguinis]MDZ7283834.1 hypothetical protein [Sphingomonas sanguinis]